MNERYLFRGKRMVSGEWVVGWLCENEYIITSAGDNGGFECVRELICHSYKIDPSTVGCCTGFRDKNGKLIFEGDVLRFGNEDELFYWHVYFDRGAFRGKYIDNSGEWNLYCLTNHEMDIIEVIDNICDNPELFNERMV